MPYECLCEAGPAATSLLPVSVSHMSGHRGTHLLSALSGLVWALVTKGPTGAVVTEIVWPPELARVPIWLFVRNICQSLKASYITVRGQEGERGWSQTARRAYESRQRIWLAVSTMPTLLKEPAGTPPQVTSLPCWLETFNLSYDFAFHLLKSSGDYLVELVGK